jgi:hypothetical protein
MGERIGVEKQQVDRTPVSYFLTISVLIISLVFYFYYFDEVGVFNSQEIHGEGGLFTLSLSLFRIACAYLVFHTAVFWMIRNPVPGKMVPLFREERVNRKHPSKGFERLVPFSSWTMIIFGIAMLWNGISSLLVFFGIDLSETILHIGTAIFATAFSSAALTAIIVRYVILPSMMNNGQEIDHMFLPHEQVMHNLALIFLSLELILGTIFIRPPMIFLGLTYGAIYLIFSEFWARYGGGYYVYEFIDPRPPEGPFFLVGLTLVCSFSFSIGMFVSFVREFNIIASLVLIIILILFSTKFSAPSDYVPTPV